MSEYKNVKDIARILIFPLCFPVIFPNLMSNLAFTASDKYLTQAGTELL